MITERSADVGGGACAECSRACTERLLHADRVEREEVSIEVTGVSPLDDLIVDRVEGFAEIGGAVEELCKIAVIRGILGCKIAEAEGVDQTAGIAGILCAHDDRVITGGTNLVTGCFKVRPCLQRGPIDAGCFHNVLVETDAGECNRNRQDVQLAVCIGDNACGGIRNIADPAFAGQISKEVLIADQRPAVRDPQIRHIVGRHADLQLRLDLFADRHDFRLDARLGGELVHQRRESCKVVVCPVNLDLERDVGGRRSLLSSSIWGLCGV